ncbi:MAG TPA: hypothetical protein VFP13_00810 [Actinomycetota bacterium]|nr:hypothetical protein [Actinomycetota bacterium]
MGTRRSIVPIALLVPLLLLGACSEDEPAPVVEPTSAFQPTGSTGATAATGQTGGTTGITGNLPTTTTGAATGNVSNGEVALTVKGDLRTSKTLQNLVSSVYAPPPGGMALVWTAGGTDATTFGIGGLSFTGTQPTSPSLSLTLTVQDGNQIITFISSAGECSITIGAATADQVSGAFTCTDLSGGSNMVVDVTGSFNAQG